MAYKRKNSDEEATGVAVLDAPVDSGEVAKAPPATAGLVKYWCPENENLIIGSDPVIEFRNHVVVLDPKKSPRSHEALQRSNAFGKTFFIVEDKAGDENYKIEFGRRLRKLVGNDPSDQVSQERGYVSICSMFTVEELDKYGISRSQPDVEKVIYVAINNKYVEGIV